MKDTRPNLQYTLLEQVSTDKTALSGMQRWALLEFHDLAWKVGYWFGERDSQFQTLGFRVMVWYIAYLPREVMKLQERPTLQ